VQERDKPMKNLMAAIELECVAHDIQKKTGMTREKLVETAFVLGINKILRDIEVSEAIDTIVMAMFTSEITKH
jgi:hypothetical protein